MHAWPDPRSRSRSRAYSRIKDRKSPIKGSRPSVPHGTNFLTLSISETTRDRVTLNLTKTSVVTDILCDIQTAVMVFSVMVTIERQ